MTYKADLLLALLLGAAMPYAFSPYDYKPLAILALGGWLFLLRKHPARPLKFGFAFGFGWFGFGGWWLADTVHIYGHLPYAVGLLVVAALGTVFTLFIQLWAWLHAKLSHTAYDSLWLFPALGTLEEWLRSFVFTGLPWTAIANISIATPFAPWLSITGSYGVTFAMLAMISATVLLTQRQTQPAALLVLACCAVWIFAAPNISIPDKPTHRAALVQPNIPQDKKWDADFVRETMFRLVNLSGQAKQPDLIVWPEAAVPMYLSRNPAWKDWLTRYFATWQADVAFGGIQQRDNGKAQSGLFLFQKDSQQWQFTGKRHLVPFGEYVPAWLPFLGKIIPDIGDFEPGRDAGVLDGSQQRIGAIICYESLFPEESRGRVRHGADVLVVVTNDAWYGKSPAAWQHFQASQVRAIESGRFVLRAANTGITAIIAPDGSIQNTMPWWQEGVVIGHYQPLSHDTLYQQWGDSPVLTLIFFLIALGVYQKIQNQRKEKLV